MFSCPSLAIPRARAPNAGVLMIVSASVLEHPTTARLQTHPELRVPAPPFRRFGREYSGRLGGQIFADPLWATRTHTCSPSRTKQQRLPVCAPSLHPATAKNRGRFQHIRTDPPDPFVTACAPTGATGDGRDDGIVGVKEGIRLWWWLEDGEGHTAKGPGSVTGRRRERTACPRRPP